MTLIDILDDLGIPWKEGGTHRHVMSGFVGIDCPLCSPGSGKFKMGIHAIKRFCTCWSCGWQKLSEVLALAYGRNLPESILNAVRGSNRDFPHPKQSDALKRSLKLPKGITELNKIHRRYLEHRGFNPDELAEVWGIRGIGLAAKLAWRLFIPIHNRRGEIASWTTRTIDENVEPRYSNAPPGDELLPIKSLLYGEWLAGHSVIVCEGPTDVWRIGPGAVATLGAGFSREQVLRIASKPVRCICYDPDVTGRQKARRLARLLEPFAGSTTIIDLAIVDPGSSDKKTIRDLRRRFLS